MDDRQHAWLIDAIRSISRNLQPLTCIARGEHEWDEDDYFGDCIHCGKHRDP